MITNQEIAYYNEQVSHNHDEIVLDVPVSKMDYEVFRQVAEDQGISISQAIIGLVMEYIEDKQDEADYIAFMKASKTQDKLYTLEEVSDMVTKEELAIDSPIYLKVAVPKELQHTLQELATAEGLSLEDFIVESAIERVENVHDYQIALEYESNKQKHTKAQEAKAFFESLGYDYV